MDNVTDQVGIAATLPTLNDFKEDLRKQFRRELRAAGYEVEESLTPQGTAVRFRVVQLRWIEPRSRRVWWSEELLARTLRRDIDLALTTITNESIAGMDLNPRTSRKQHKSMFDDQLFNDWGVNHLHLGAPGAGKRGLAGGTSDLLFVKVTDDAVYFVDVKDHRIFNTRCDEGFMEILHANWPLLIAPYRSRSARRLERKDTPEERVLVRKGFTSEGQEPKRTSFMFSLVELRDGTVYYPPGGGVTTVGSSVHAARWAIELFVAVRDMHHWCVAHVDVVADALLREHRKRPVDLRGLHIRLDGNVLRLFDQPTGITIPIA